MPPDKPCDAEVSIPSSTSSGSFLLPWPVAHAVSLATRSTSLAIRVGSVVGCYSLDAARFTTLSSLWLARGLAETVLSRAARDTISLSRSGQDEKETENVLERSLESLHFAVTQIVFWTSAGFRLTGTTISTASEASQLLLASLDTLFGSTDSSRAVASIITLVRREFNNSAAVTGGDKVGVSDLVAAIGSLAYLQGISRRSAPEERRRQRYDETIWDVVVLSDGERIDIGEQADTDEEYRLASDGDNARAGEGGRPDDDAVIDRLRSYITSNLDPGTSASLSNSISSVQTITVNVNGPQMLSLPTPPGAEIVETRGPATSGNRRLWEIGQDNKPSYTIVYRIQRDRYRSTMLRGEETGPSPNVVEILDDDHSSQTAESDKSQPTTPTVLEERTPSQENRKEDTTCKGSTALNGVDDSPCLSGGRENRSPDGGIKSRRKSQPSIFETTANQKKQRHPYLSSSRRSSLDKKLLNVDTGKRHVPRTTDSPSSGAQKQTEKRPGLKQVLKESSQSISNIWNRESFDAELNRAVLRQRPQWKGPGGAVSPGSSGNSKSLGSRSQSQQTQRNTSSRRYQTPTPLPRPSSRDSHVSVRESRRNSMFSHHDSNSRRNSTAGTPPASPTVIRTDVAATAQETISRAAPEASFSLGPVPPSPVGIGQIRRSLSHTPSMYSMATNDSQSSLLLASYYQKSAYNASNALNVLRNEGFVDGSFPSGHLLSNMARYMRYSSACYGSHFMKILGISKEGPASKVWDGTHEDVRHFAHHTESSDGNILLASFVDPQGGSDATGSTGTGVPLVHYISLDHDAKAVVLACRGTLGFEDVLADLKCDYDNLTWRGRTYRVHKGVHASARRLLFGDDGRVLVTLRESLMEFPDYGLVLCGHSLGGGVTSLLGVMLAEPNPDGPGFVISAGPHSRLLTEGPDRSIKFSSVRLPQGRRIHVHAYGPPGVMSPSLRKITRGLITTIVHGNDVVPYLSLGVLHDFQGLALAFKKDENGSKVEIRRRMWQSLQEHVADRWYQTTPVAPRESDDDFVLPMLQSLRDSMRGKKLVPPGEVFTIDQTRVLRRDAFVPQDEGGLGQPATRAVLKYVRDVEGRFKEIRFGAGLLTDHSPAKYEDALNKLRLGVVD